MQSSYTPDAGRVPVSTAGTPVPDWDLGCPPDVGASLSEQSCLRYLVKECGWYWLEAGVLKRAWRKEGE